MIKIENLNVSIEEKERVKAHLRMYWLGRINIK